jgi:hypothetical protein
LGAGASDENVPVLFQTFTLPCIWLLFLFCLRLKQIHYFEEIRCFQFCISFNIVFLSQTQAANSQRPTDVEDVIMRIAQRLK